MKIIRNGVLVDLAEANAELAKRRALREKEIQVVKDQIADDLKNGNFQAATISTSILKQLSKGTK